ncbi:MAG: serine/threonine protein kinase [Vezdaea aestivalis]|nr:MAG: serine/threonine protein kinase [Vezdaea aestivalis]
MAGSDKLSPEGTDSTKTVGVLPSPQQAVRFSSQNQEIEPTPATEVSSKDSGGPPRLSEAAEKELSALSETLQHSHLQQRRMSNFGFEPVSLPASRVPSNDSSLPHSKPSSRPVSRHPSEAPGGDASPRNTMLTPAATRSRDENRPGDGSFKRIPDSSVLTPETSGPRGTPPPITLEKPPVDQLHPGSTTSSRPNSSDRIISTEPTSLSEGSSVVASHPKHTPKFSIGPTGDSIPPSRDSSPAETPQSTSGTGTPSSKVFPPNKEREDLFSRNRKSHVNSVESVDPRDFSKRNEADKGRILNPASATDVRTQAQDKKHEEKRHSHIFSFGKRDHLSVDDSSGEKSRHGSMSDLKRFFRVGGNKNSKRSHSPAPSSKGKSSSRTPSLHSSQSYVPFGEDHGLESRYGRFGKLLGAGAGGSVRLIRRQSDGVTFAVKQFRARHTYENEKEYAKKVTAEYCIGSTLHNGNVIETLDLVQEKGAWFEVMEYAPFDLFATVMTGKMTREEVACAFLQILNGVSYLHEMGLAHRDLKLDNVVVNSSGIMKIIDFGSASMFKYSFENELVLASGIVGSDPYLAPEVYDLRKYDPQPTDIWSLAIIFACMSLRRFPWKAPRSTDASYKKFSSRPTQPDSASTLRHPSEPTDSSTTDSPAPHHHHHHHSSTSPSSETQTPAAPLPKPEEILGPWRLLRLLPRESRHIIGRMLEIDPNNRAILQEVLDDPWCKGAQVCHQEVSGQVTNAPGHTHTLEPGSGQGPPSAGADKGKKG